MFLVFLTLVALALVSPFIALWGAWNAVRPATRRYGLRVLAASLVGGIGAVTCVALSVDGVAALMWLVLFGTGFTLIGAPVAVFGHPTVSRAGAA